LGGQIDVIDRTQFAFFEDFGQSLGFDNRHFSRSALSPLCAVRRFA